ncbi:hypothetical protein [Vagococcus intermedius]|uniref:Uncharacterized protein n=1 Tax=Vagococcus intermedius TaxID=2991418 RepID=A0AAF0CX56_9ENTE|nr:hypothetical protein [Vagococcus intermedius]WEG74433.1 hypothetical protein OL234_10930 [Vagococcus intermedius]WEG76457.1 hypothetical protein OL235_10595 [Vagococcus intermedius]
MFDKYKEFTEKHPYIYVMLIMIVASFIGISIEYIVNKDFIGGGLYTALALTVVEFLRVRKRDKKIL